MNLEQTAALLARVQVIDNRKVDEATVLAWQELLGDVDYPAALEAVKLHFRESTAYLLPAHVRANVTRIMTAEDAPVDEWGNRLEPDWAALDAMVLVRRGGLRAVTS